MAEEKDDSIKISQTGIKNSLGKTLAFLRKKWVINFAIIIFLIFIVSFSSLIRTSNIPNLKDSTTGQYTLGPDLDPFLYLRLVHEMIDHGKILNPDYMRYHGAPAWENFVPYGIFYLYKFLNIFSPITPEYAAIIFPVIFFGASIMVFFFFVREVFYKKEELQKTSIAIIATSLYSVIPLMLHRTTAGIPELESAGLFFFWLSFLFFLRAWRDEGKIFKIKRSYALALASGIATCFMIFTWGGYRFILYSLALTTIIAFFIGKVGRKETMAYSLWFIPSFLYLSYKSGLSVAAFDITYGAIPLFVFIVLLAGLFVNQKILDTARRITKRDWINKELVAFFSVAIIGLLALFVIKPNTAIALFSDLKEHLLYPFGRARVGLTVAENQQLYLTDFFSSFGASFFWMFFLGLILLFNETITCLEKKERIFLLSSFIIFLIGFIFSRYSSNSIFNGVTFISQFCYFAAMAVLAFSMIYIYIKNLKKNNGLENFREINFSYLFLILMLILMTVASRGAIRLLFISAPVFIISTAFLPISLINYRMKSKDDLLRFFLIILILASIFYIAVTLKNYEAATANEARYTIPDQYSIQWQKAMAWVRSETPANSIFVHWWDYGYWIQTLGERPTVTDGGHEITYWDHLIGRYLLTNPNNNSALSFMKTQNVSYLLIDSTDIGKYPAYSSIANGNASDRLSQIPVMILDNSQTQETNNTEIKVYRGTSGTDEDIVYFSEDENQVFLPGGRTALYGIIIQSAKTNDSSSFRQPKAVFIYSQKQVTIPIRYMQYDNKFLDFGGGLDAVIKVIPMVSQNNQGIQIDRTGALIYLSPRVSKSLIAQLYLLNDPLKKYQTLTIAHSEPDFVSGNLNSQGAGLGDIIYFNGLRGPIKIWKVNYPENVLVKDEFLKTSGGYGEFDDLTFIRE